MGKENGSWFSSQKSYPVCQCNWRGEKTWGTGVNNYDIESKGFVINEKGLLLFLGLIMTVISLVVKVKETVKIKGGKKCCVS